MMSSEPQLGQRRKGGMLDIGDEDYSYPLFYLPFTKRHYLKLNSLKVLVKAKVGYEIWRTNSVIVQFFPSMPIDYASF